MRARCGARWRVWAWSSSGGGGNRTVTTSTSTPRSRPASRAPRAPLPMKRSTWTPSGRGATCRSWCCSTSRGPRASRPRRVAPCTSISGRLLPGSSPPWRISVTGLPSTPSVPRGGRPSKCSPSNPSTTRSLGRRRPARLHAARRGDPARRGGSRSHRWDLAAHARRLLRRLRLRPRLRGRVRRGRRPPRARRGKTPGHRLPLSQHRGGDRPRRTATGLRHLCARPDPAGGPAPRGGGSLVPIGAPVGGASAPDVAARAPHAGAIAGREENGVTPGTRPYYVPVGNEEQVFGAAYRQGLSVLLKGPTGCGKTRFVEAMAHDLGRQLVTVACHDDLTTADLVGRFLLEGGDTTWVDGPLTRAVREGAICYLDEVVEARQDTTVVLHPLADHRRQLPIDRLGVTLDAASGFCLVVSYNPGYQSVLKDLKDSTRQRMVAIELDFPPVEVEEKVVAHEAGVDHEMAQRLVHLGQAIRRLEGVGLREVASTRVLIAAGRLVGEGLPVRDAARSAVAGALTDDPVVSAGLVEMIDAYLDDEPA